MSLVEKNLEDSSLLSLLSSSGSEGAPYPIPPSVEPSPVQQPHLVPLVLQQALVQQLLLLLELHLLVKVAGKSLQTRQLQLLRLVHLMHLVLLLLLVLPQLLQLLRLVLRQLLLQLPLLLLELHLLLVDAASKSRRL
jgi:hypothetical protein